MGVTQARKFQNYTPQKNLGAKIKVLRFHWMRVYHIAWSVYIKQDQFPKSILPTFA